MGLKEYSEGLLHKIHVNFPLILKAAPTKVQLDPQKLIQQEVETLPVKAGSKITNSADRRILLHPLYGIQEQWCCAVVNPFEINDYLHGGSTHHN